MYSLNIEKRRVSFHETPILNKNRISILCSDENLDIGNPLVYVDFYFVVLNFGEAGRYFARNVRRANLDAKLKCLRDFPAIRCMFDTCILESYTFYSSHLFCL